MQYSINCHQKDLSPWRRAIWRSRERNEEYSFTSKHRRSWHMEGMGNKGERFMRQRFLDWKINYSGTGRSKADNDFIHVGLAHGVVSACQRQTTHPKSTKETGSHLKELDPGSSCLSEPRKAVRGWSDIQSSKGQNLPRIVNPAKPPFRDRQVTSSEISPCESITTRPALQET